MLDRLRMYGRFVTGLRRFLRRQLALPEAEAFIREQMRERERNFLRLVERAVYGYEASPYRPLLEMAGCGFTDFRRMVRSDGIEATLGRLRDAGVYVSFEEFKGRAPIVRNGREIPVAAWQFDNPYPSSVFTTSSGGSTGAGTRVSTDLEHLAREAAHALVLRAAHGVARSPTALWRPVLPAGSGINNLLKLVHTGRTPRRWFSPVTPADMPVAPRFRLANTGTIWLGRLFGFPMPMPEPVRLSEGIKIARWMAETARIDGTCLLLATVSSGVRVCNAAREAGLDMTGCSFMVAGEPATPAKVEQIRAVGGRHFTTYGTAEVGRVAIGCANPIGPNDLHVTRDVAAIIQRPRSLGPGLPTVESYHLTSMSPTAPKILLNVEIDDCGVLEERSCGCPLEQFGYTWHVRDIRSYTKLTGEGVTLVTAEMLSVLETVLPRRFGGSPIDYQIQEEEGEDGLTQLVLRVSPRLGPVDETAVVGALAEGLQRSSQAGGYAQAVWAQAGSFRVRREEPVWTARGKLPQLRGRGRFRGGEGSGTRETTGQAGRSGAK